MIDTMYQAGTDAAIADRLKRPLPNPVPGIGTWANVSGGFGGAGAGPNHAAAAWMDLLHGSAEVLASTGTQSGGGMFSTPSDAETKQNNAAHDRIMAQGVDFNSATGAQFRAQAKDFMPDPQTTGKAGQILAGLLDFGTQAVPAGFAGPPGLVALGAERGVQKSEDLKEQGVDLGTRTVAGLASGTLDAASMLLPMSGSTRLIAAGKGAAGGAGISVVQTEAEKLILQHGGYDKLASTYDPFDPTSIALAALVPAAFGALHAPSRADHPGASSDLASAQAATDAARGSADRIPTLEAEMAKPETTQASRVALQAEIDQIRQSGARAALDPTVEAAARVTQAAEAVDHSRLTPDDDLPGRDQHQQAIETAADQLGAGEPVDVRPIFGDTMFDSMRDSRALADRIDYLEERRAQLLGDAGNLLQPGEASALHAQIADLQSKLTDASPAAVKARAQELQGQDVSYKQASAKAQRELSGQLADQQATIDRLQQRLASHAAAAQATEHLSLAERDLTAARERAEAAPGPRTTPRRLSIAVANALREMQQAPRAPRANPEAFHEAPARDEAAVEPGAEPALGETKAPESGTKTGPRETGGAKPEVLPGPTDAHLDAAVSQLDPDMMVHMDGMPHAVRLGDLMDSVRAEAADSTRDAKLLEVAAQCSLSFPAAA